MHFEILVEDRSGEIALQKLVPKIVGEGDTFRVIAYKGIGRIPKNLNADADAEKRILLDRLPALIRGYGGAFQGYPQGYSAVLVIVCDLDRRDFCSFRAELLNLLASLSPKPTTQFCIAIEEGEAWFLGDLAAVRAAYPSAREGILQSYTNDEICGTWEKLADALYAGGATRLSKEGWQRAGLEKARWARTITNHMNVENNQSPSFCYFRDKLRSLSIAGQ